MTIYDEVMETYVSQFGARPPVPNRSQYTKWYAYRAGECLGTFNTLAEANATNPASTERFVDDTAYKADRDAVIAWDRDLRTMWKSAVRMRLCADLTDDQFVRIYSMVVSQHSDDMGALEDHIADFADFARSFIKDVS